MHTETNKNDELIIKTADIVSAHVSNNNVALSDLPRLIDSVHGALSGIKETSVVKHPKEPAIPISKSVKDDHIVCLICGRKMKMLKRHLSAYHDMTPEQYRKMWNLSPDYPMTSPNYAKVRSRVAKDTGLGTGNSKR